MMSLLFDVETTGKFNYRLPPGDDSQPDVLQLAAILADENRTYATLNVYIHGESPVPEEAYKIHRIDRDMTAKVGISRKRMCQIFADLLQKADVLVCHNTDFDVAMMRSSMLREGGNGKLLNKPLFCTMKRSTERCKIPHPKPFRAGEFKWPSLQEAYQILVDPRGFEEAHDAWHDICATREVYRVLCQHPQ
jgi:DNA polymerase-3 subunit epsilon